MKKTHITALLLVFVLLFATAAGVTYAKYIRSYEHTGNVTVTAKLVSVFELYESKAVKQDNGSYVLNTSSQVSKNTYTLLPGLDVPKDPQIHIDGKTNIPAYLYVEVVESTNFDKAKIAYALTDDWQKLDGVAGQHGGTVYVYTEALNGTIQILHNNVITVSDQLPRTTNVSLDFYAYMAQIGSGQTVETVFTSNFPPSTP